MHLYPLGRRYLIPSQSLKSPSYSLFIEQSIYPRQGAGVHFRWAWLMVGATRNHTAHWHRRRWFALQSALISQSTQFDTPANGKYNTTSLLIRHQSLIFSQRTNLAHFHYRSYSKLKSVVIICFREAVPSLTRSFHPIAECCWARGFFEIFLYTPFKQGSHSSIQDAYINNLLLAPGAWQSKAVTSARQLPTVCICICQHPQSTRILRSHELIRFSERYQPF